MGVSANTPKERLERLRTKDRHTTPVSPPQERVTLLSYLVGALLRAWTQTFNPSRTNVDRVRERLMLAGFPFGLRAREFIALRQILGLICLAIAVDLVELILGSATWTDYLLYGSAGALVGSFIPAWIIVTLIRKRQRQVGALLPDFIDLLTVSVEAGLGLDAAWQRVSEQFPGPLGEEGRRISNQIRVGLTRSEAMRDMAQRLGIPELTRFVSALLQSEQIGATIGTTLRIQSQQMREYRAQRVRERAQKAPVKIIFVLIFLILPTLAIVVVGPTIIEAWENLRGVLG